MNKWKNLSSKALALLQLIGYGGKGERARENSPSKTGRQDFPYSASATVTIRLETICFTSGVNYCGKNWARLKLDTFQKIGVFQSSILYGLYKIESFWIFASNLIEKFESNLKSLSLILTEI